MTPAESTLMLSHSGLRGIVGRSLTHEIAARYAQCVGAALRRGAKHDPCTVVVGRDSRPSGDDLEHAVLEGLLAAGCRVTRLGIVTTPGVGVMLSHHHADGGIIVTASHNPAPWNGIKMLTSRGTAPTPREAGEVIEAFKAARAPGTVIPANDVDLNDVESDHTTHERHVQRILDHIDKGPIATRGFHAVIDSVHGAGGPATAVLAKALGVRTHHLYAEPTGAFPHEPEPTINNLRSLCDVVRSQGADIGFAQDPDADRLAIVDDQGHYIGEEYTLALCCRHVLSQSGRAATVAANLSTSRMIDDAAVAHGATVVRTAVGEANVADAMLEHTALIGGEGNGGVIWPAVVMVRDSLAGIALVLEMLATRKQRLSEIVASIPHYSIVKAKVDLASEQIHFAADRLQGLFNDATSVNNSDGLRYDWRDRWIHVRPSNTEPIVRIIAEAVSEPMAREMVAKARDCLLGE